MFIIPSPPFSEFSLGIFTIHMYSICILLGLSTSYIITKKRLRLAELSASHLDSLILISFVSGIIGARLYHVITDYSYYFHVGGDPLKVLRIWEGGLSIWGGLFFGFLSILAYNKFFTPKYKQKYATHPLPNNRQLFVAIIPGLMLAQAIGRLGNWFNQELFGHPTTLPWGMRVDHYRIPNGFSSDMLYHPLFLYESLWLLIGAFLFTRLRNELQLRLGLSIYIAWYCAGRFLLESFRIDDALVFFGLRINSLLSLFIFILSSIVILIRMNFFQSKYIILPVFAIASLDQISKTIAIKYLTNNFDSEFNNLTIFSLKRNAGAAFSIGESRTQFISVLSIIIITLVYMKRRAIYDFSFLRSDNLNNTKIARSCIKLSQALFLGGAVGNILDRIFRTPAPLQGNVIDFISIGKFPIFNLADISISAGLMIWAVLLLYDKKLISNSEFKNVIS